MTCKILSKVKMRMILLCSNKNTCCYDLPKKTEELEFVKGEN